METDVTSDGKIFIDTFISENLETLTKFIFETGIVKLEVRYGEARLFSSYRYVANIDCKHGHIVFNKIIDNVYLETFLSLNTNCKGVICNRHMRRKCCFRYFANQIKDIIDKIYYPMKLQN